MRSTRSLKCVVFFLSLASHSVFGQNTTENGTSNLGTTLNPNMTTPVSTTEGTIPKTTTKEPIKILQVVTLLDPPFVMTTVRGNQYQGLAVDVLNAAVTKLGYGTVNIYTHQEAQFGYEENPGQWNGLIGEVQNKTADVALAAFTINSKSSSVVKFTQPFMHAGFRVLYKIPDSWYPSDTMVTVLRPFTPGLWVLIIFMFALASAALYIIGRYSPYEDIAFVGKTATYEGLTVTNSMLYIFSSLVWQSYTAAPKSISGRILTSVWWVFTVFAIGAYIAGLCVVLFKVNPEIRTLPFTTMEEMSRQSKVGIMVVNNSATFIYLNNSPEKLERRILATLNAHKEELIVSTTEHGIDKMIQSDGKLALLMDGPTARYLSTQEPCDKMVIGDPLGFHTYGFACRNDTDICDKLSTEILAMWEDGRLSNWRKKWFHTYGFACRNDTDICDKLSTEILAMWEDGRLSNWRKKWFHTGCLEDQPKSYVFEGLPFFDTFGGEPDAIMPLTITVKRFSAAFIILTIGIILAAIVLIIEIVWARRRGTAVPRKLNHSVGRDDDLERIENEFHDERS